MSSLVAELALCLVLARVAVYSTCLVADSRVVFNEIHYHPAETLDRHEFIEFYNAGDSVSDVSDWRIQGGVSFQFPDGSQIEAGGYLVVASDPEVMWQDFDVAAAGPDGDRRLDRWVDRRVANEPSEEPARSEPAAGEHGES